MTVAALGVLAGVSASSAAQADVRSVPCRYIIDYTRFPYYGDIRRDHRYRQVLGVVAAPPAYMPQVVATGEKPWAYWSKVGLVIRATGEPVTVTVPKAWRTRAAVIWGNGGGTANELHIAGCRASSKIASAKIGNAYAGGFYLRSSSACVPLIFTVGKRSATLRFGVGTRCPDYVSAKNRLDERLCRVATADKVLDDLSLREREPPLSTLARSILGPLPFGDPSNRA